MIFDVSIAMTWILFLALFPMAFFWLRRSWRILVRKNYAEVAIKRGLPPAHPKKWAPVTGLLNLACGAIAIWIIIGVVMARFTYDEWSAMAGLTIWGKIIADFIIRSQAHPFTFGRKKKLVTASK